MKTALPRSLAALSALVAAIFVVACSAATEDFDPAADQGQELVTADASSPTADGGTADAGLGCCLTTRIKGTCVKGPVHRFCGEPGTHSVSSYTPSTEAACPFESTSGTGTLPSVCGSLATGAACEEREGQHWVSLSCADEQKEERRIKCSRDRDACNAPYEAAYAKCVADCKIDPDPGWIIKTSTWDQCIAKWCKPPRDRGRATCDAQYKLCVGS